MSQRKGLLSRIAAFFAPLAKGAVNVAAGGLPVLDEQLERAARADDRASMGAALTATVEVAPPPRDSLRITYTPSIDGAPDAGEIVWTWVPYAEHDGRGKDRPVLVIAGAPEGRVYAVKLTSKPRDGDRDFIAIGSGPWDSRGRPSWVDIDQVYIVHPDGMRREASALDLHTFVRVADALRRRYGWDAGS